jgi:hypothetical protein
MSTSFRRPAALVALISAAASASAASASVTPVTIALSGTATPAGGTFSAFTNPVLNASGEVAFAASVAGGTSTSGIFTGTSAGTQAIALQGTPAPAGGNFGSLYTSSTTTSLTLNSGGTLAFQAPLTSGTSTSGIFSGTLAATLGAVALQGTASPGGGTYNAFGATGINAAISPVLNSSQIAFTSTLSGNGTATAGIFVGTTGALQTAALLGQPAPGTSYNYATALTQPVVNASGQVSFISLVNGGYGLFAGAPGSVQLVALQGTAAPGGAGTYGTISTSPSINNNGQVAYYAALTGGSGNYGVFAGAPGSVQPVALVGGVAPGTGGETYGGVTNVTINGAGQVAFTASSLTGGSATSGLFLGAPGSVQAVALTGGTAPDGETYTSFGSTLLSNDIGDVAFLVNVSGGGTEELVAGTPGSLTELVKEGDIVDGMTVNGFGLLTGSGGQDGKGIDFNDTDEVAYRLTFTNGSSGVFESMVPEPASLGLFALSAIPLLRRRRRIQPR